MKIVATLILILITHFSFGQNTYEEWEAASKENIRLLPKYGNIEKTDRQKQADQEFIASISAMDEYKGDLKVAFKKFIDLGFTYLNKGDIKTAMYRFNQAYLLDSTNTDIYWGYGAVYFALNNLDKSKEMYEEGLAINPNNTHLLTDLATNYMSRFYNDLESFQNNIDNIDKVDNLFKELDNAIPLLNTSYKLDPKDQNTLFKLSVCYYLKNDCKQAKKYYEECMQLGGDPITEDYKKDIKDACK